MKKLVLGFTGSRTGMNEFQMDAFCTRVELHLEHNDEIEFHHGDCTGADAQAHELMRGFILTLGASIKIIGHPGDLNRHRAFCEGFDIYKEPLDPLVRNRIIVDACKEIIATPNTKLEQRRSGTWSTIRYARHTHTKTYLITPYEAELLLNKKKKGAKSLFRRLSKELA